jgi:pyruvate ferredoxin oxidoreductase alpha subunit
MEQDELVWRVAGGSGDGIDSTSQNFAKALMRSGLHVFTHRHYPSRIRGGHTYVEIRARDEPVSSRGDGYNFLLALGDSFARNPQEDAYYGNEEVKPLAENLDDLRAGGVVVYDAGLVDADEVPEFRQRAEANDWHVYPLDLRGIAKEHGREVMRNVAGLGATAALLDVDPAPVADVLSEVMDGDALDANLAVLSETFDHVRAEYDPTHDVRLPTGTHDDEQVLLSGSHAVAYGAIDAGCRFVAGYPMTPWSDVFTILSQQLPEMGGIAEQVEDEIAAASMAIGASHAGVKALTGSSGGGFALMSEPLGLAEMAETPLVMVEAMRAGPSTGMPTKPEQADLEHVLYTSQGDSVRAVLAPGDLAEAYEQTRTAFEIAYDYQVPAVVLIDQKLSSEYRTLDRDFFDRRPTPDLGSVASEEEIAAVLADGPASFPRYRHDPEDGVSPRSLPGQKGGRFLATGNEHVESGHISEDPENRVAQVDRRLRKLDAIREELDAATGSNQTFVGPEDADYGVLTWGSQQGTVFEAVGRLRGEGRSVRALGVSDLAPFPREEVGSFIDGCEAVLVVEMNASAQFRGLVQAELDGAECHLASLLRYDGNPFEPAGVVDGVEAMVEGGTVPGDDLTFEPPVSD